MNKRTKKKSVKMRLAKKVYGYYMDAKRALSSLKNNLSSMTDNDCKMLDKSFDITDIIVFKLHDVVTHKNKNGVTVFKRHCGRIIKYACLYLDRRIDMIKILNDRFGGWEKYENKMQKK